MKFNDFLTEEIIKKMSAKKFGKLAAIVFDEGLAEKIICSNTDIRFKKEEGRDKNESGYDRMTNEDKRIQFKIRQVEGVSPFSRQTYLENTRRHSKKNIGMASKSGHTAYSSDEFDILFLALIHKSKREINKWFFCAISVEELKDKENEGFLNTKITSSILKKYGDIKNEKWKNVLEELNNA